MQLKLEDSPRSGPLRALISSKPNRHRLINASSPTSVPRQLVVDFLSCNPLIATSSTFLTRPDYIWLALHYCNSARRHHMPTRQLQKQWSALPEDIRFLQRHCTSPKFLHKPDVTASLKDTVTSKAPLPYASRILPDHAFYATILTRCKIACCTSNNGVVHNVGSHFLVTILDRLRKLFSHLTNAEGLNVLKSSQRMQNSRQALALGPLFVFCSALIGSYNYSCSRKAITKMTRRAGLPLIGFD